MVSCGGQATIPMVYAVSRVVDVPYAEIVATVASRSAGPGTRANIDEFTRTTASAVELLGGAGRGKAIIILNPAEPPLIMRDTIFCQIPEDADHDAIEASIDEVVAQVQGYVPGYRLRQRPQFDPPAGNRPAAGRDLHRGRGRRGLPPAVLREPRHHDCGGNEGRRGDRPEPDGGQRLMPYSDQLDIRVTDSSLRDGSHAKGHQFDEQMVRAVVAGLDSAGMPVIEVTHGDGLGGSSFNYGFGLEDERKLIAAAVDEATRAKIAALMLPGLGTKDDIAAVADLGASVIRIATHCTEADISIQHFGLARELGLETVGFLMMAHSQPPEVLAAQARIMVDAGCQCVYVVDSAGAMILDEVGDRVRPLVDEIGDDAQVGFHGHENLALGVANSIFAIRAGATQIDGSTRRFGAGAGNTPCEALVAVCDKLGIRTGIDVLRHVRRRRGRRAAGDGRRVRPRSPVADHGLRRRLLVLPQARLPRRRALRRLGRRHPARVRRATTSSAARRTRSSTSP